MLNIVNIVFSLLQDKRCGSKTYLNYFPALVALSYVKFGVACYTEEMYLSIESLLFINSNVMAK